ncbi:uncharacterized protein BXZ73DRAFT_104550 [Epithele typhae]|uniref:uncharacterized protein n=1 Tax=Epithele typhae TaxID=378194 RepID=UPI0020084417|nr:uncharacterized protein BXZ73DRAFT_104550 [Epithele typhae]KAH9921261.1 hypothetical protein BXZ73DRAFT_104550 [Epithele typhae]
MALIFDRLNDDIFLIILSYLQRRDLSALSLTCKHFHKLSSPRRWTALATHKALYVSWWHDNIGTNARYVREILVVVNERAPMLPDVLFATKNIRFEGGPSVSGDLLSLLSAIKSFPRLYVLILKHFTPTTAVDIACHPSFPSIQQLTLHDVTEPATDLFYLCPNVTSLRLGLNVFHQAHESRPRWRSSPIPRLTLTALRMEARDFMVSFLEQRPMRATHVRLSALWEFTWDGISSMQDETASQLACVLTTLHPRSLYLEIPAILCADLSDRTGTLWQEVAAAAPHLRALVLHVDSSLSDDDTRWAPPDALVAELARLPLICVHLKADPDFIPTLRVVGVSDGSRKLEGARSTQWWRVERGNGNSAVQSLVELWREDGERALLLVQSEAFCASDLDDIYSEKCRYVRG